MDNVSQASNRIKRPRRNSSTALIYCAVSALLIIILTLFGISFFTRTNEIEVIGALKYTKQEIIEASGFSIGDNLIFLNTDLAEVRIQTLLPHISEVIITPVFPDTIRISVTESSPIATLRHRNGILVIDSGARVVEIKSADDPVPFYLIEVRGFTPSGAELGNRLRVELANESQLQYLIDILTTIEEEDFFNDITYIDISNIANIAFDYIGRYRVILDSPGNIAQNMSLLRIRVAEAEQDGRIPAGARGTIRVSDSRGELVFTENR